MAEAPRPAGLHKRRAGADYGFGGQGCWRRSYSASVQSRRLEKSQGPVPAKVFYPLSIHQSLPYIFMPGADGQVAARRRSCRTSLRSHDEDQVSKMTRTELIIQLLK